MCLYCNNDGRKERRKKKNRNLKFLLTTPPPDTLPVTPRSLHNSVWETQYDCTEHAAIPCFCVCLHNLHKHPLEIGSSLVNLLIQASIESSLYKKQMYYEQTEVACYYSSCHLQK